MASLLSCIRIDGESPSATVLLTFDTVRRDRQKRVYIMDEKDAQVISVQHLHTLFTVAFCHIFNTSFLLMCDLHSHPDINAFKEVGEIWTTYRRREMFVMFWWKTLKAACLKDLS